MYRSLLGLIAGLSATALCAQVNDRINAEPEDLAKLAKRTLVVELPEPNQRVIEDFPKKTAAADAAAYKASLDAYREKIEPAVRAHWKFNSNIEFKTTSEIVELFKNKSSKYVALLKVVLPDGMGEPGCYTFGMGVPAIVLTRTDGDSKVTKKGELRLRNHDFQAYLVVEPGEDGTETYTEASMKLTLMLCQHYLDFNIHNKKSVTFMKYLKEMSEKNCPKLASKKLVVDQNGLYKKTTPAEIRENYGKNVEFVERAELGSTYLAGGSDEAVLYSIPVGTVSGSMLVVTITRLAYTKVVVDPSTSEVLNAIVPGMGKSFVEGLIPADARQLAKCKD